MRNLPRQQKGIPMKMVEQEERLASFSGLVASLLPVGGKLSAIAALLLLSTLLVRRFNPPHKPAV